VARLDQPQDEPDPFRVGLVLLLAGTVVAEEDTGAGQRQVVLPDQPPVRWPTQTCDRSVPARSSARTCAIAAVPAVVWMVIGAPVCRWAAAAARITRASASVTRSSGEPTLTTPARTSVPSIPTVSSCTKPSTSARSGLTSRSSAPRQYCSQTCPVAATTCTPVRRARRRSPARSRPSSAVLASTKCPPACLDERLQLGGGPLFVVQHQVRIAADLLAHWAGQQMLVGVGRPELLGGDVPKDGAHEPAHRRHARPADDGPASTPPPVMARGPRALGRRPPRRAAAAPPGPRPPRRRLPAGCPSPTASAPASR
jgi:hypothetical protein